MSVTAEQLRNLCQERKRKDLEVTVKLIVNEFIVPAAEAGETSILIKQDAYSPRMGHPIKHRPALSELVNALQRKFPDTLITTGSETTLRDNGTFEKKEHIHLDWSVKEIPPPTKGCREMSKCFTHGQRIRHYMPKNGSILYGIYDAQQDRIVLESGETVGGPCGVANQHYKKHGLPHGKRDGWGDCECEIDGKWVSTYSLSSL